MILPDAGRRVQAAIQCWKSLMAVDAVCGELASAMNSLVSGNFAGKCTYLQHRAAAINPENLRVREMRWFLAGNLGGTDQGKVLLFQR